MVDPTPMMAMVRFGLMLMVVDLDRDFGDVFHMSRARHHCPFIPRSKGLDSPPSILESPKYEFRSEVQPHILIVKVPEAARLFPRFIQDIS